MTGSAGASDRAGQQEPLVSIVLNTYNRAAILPRSLGSILNQTFDDFEVVVVDDGSSDNTRDVVLAAEDDRVRYVHQENAGLSRARNTGLAAARGRWVTFFDDDDEVDAAWLEELALASRTPRCAVVCCGAVAIGGGLEPRVLLPSALGPVFDGYTGLFQPATFAARRDVLHAIGGFASDLKVSHQTELALRLAPYCTAHQLEVQSCMKPLVTIHRAPATSRARYQSGRLVDGVEYFLAHHRDRLSLSPDTLAHYLAIAGVGAIRGGNPVEARRYFLQAVKAAPRRWKHYLRLAVALLPPLANRVWSTQAYADSV